MTDPEIRELYRLSLSVRRLFHRLGHGFERLHAASPISMGMRAVLESVIAGGPQTVPQMAQVRPVSRQHVQGLVNRLLAGGWVEYRDNPAHKRSRLVAATAAGQAAFAAMRARETEALARLELPVTAADYRAATEVLDRLIEAFGRPDWFQPDPTTNQKEDAS